MGMCSINVCVYVLLSKVEERFEGLKYSIEGGLGYWRFSAMEKKSHFIKVSQHSNNVPHYSSKTFRNENLKLETQFSKLRFVCNYVCVCFLLLLLLLLLFFCLSAEMW